MSVNALPLLLDGERLALLCEKFGFVAYRYEGYKFALASGLSPVSHRIPSSWTPSMRPSGYFVTVLPAHFVKGKPGEESYWFALFSAPADTDDSLRLLVQKWNADMMGYIGVVPDEGFASVMELCS